MELKHIIYKITFLEREQNKIYPCYYIGSKSNCYTKSNIIYDKRNKPYFGSSKHIGYKDLLKTSKLKVDILEEFDCSTDYLCVLNSEHQFQVSLDVVTNERYFNKSYACVNCWNDPNYASYKHSITGEKLRLPRDHPKVLSREYVGITYGNKLTEEHRKKISRLGEENGFFGKKHTQETKSKIAKSNKGRKHTEEFKKNISLQFKGIPKSPEHKRKIGRTGLKMVKNIYTGESRRIGVHEEPGEEWVNPVSYAAKKGTLKKIKCPHCDKIGAVSGMKRWHFENCKYKGRNKEDIPKKKSLSKKKSLQIRINGILYTSLRMASKATGISRVNLSKEYENYEHK